MEGGNGGKLELDVPQHLPAGLRANGVGMYICQYAHMSVSTYVCHVRLRMVVRMF